MSPGDRARRAMADVGESFEQARRRQIEHVLGVDVADLVRDDGERLLVVEALDERRVEDDDRALDAAGKGVDDRVLLDEQLGHVHAERRAGDLELGVEVGALLAA